MGWSGGSELMTEVISGVQSLGSVDDVKVEAFYSKLIAALENHDCDTLEECLGEDRRFDAAFFKANPYQGGFYAASKGISQNANPWAEGSTEKRRWNDGWESGDLCRE